MFEFPRHDGVGVRDSSEDEQSDDDGRGKKSMSKSGSNHNFFSDYRGDSHDLLLKSGDSSQGYLGTWL